MGSSSSIIIISWSPAIPPVARKGSTSSVQPVWYHGIPFIPYLWLYVFVSYLRICILFIRICILFIYIFVSTDALGLWRKMGCGDSHSHALKILGFLRGSILFSHAPFVPHTFCRFCLITADQTSLPSLLCKKKANSLLLCYIFRTQVRALPNDNRTDILKRNAAYAIKKYQTMHASQQYNGIFHVTRYRCAPRRLYFTDAQCFVIVSQTQNDIWLWFQSYFFSWDTSKKKFGLFLCPSFKESTDSTFNSYTVQVCEISLFYVCNKVCFPPLLAIFLIRHNVAVVCQTVVSKST